MKISLNWIKEYIDLPSDIDMEKLSYDLTMRTVEVEGYENFAEKYNEIVAGKVTEVKPHPDADKLRVAMVDIGTGEDVQIVCGGSNLEVGTFVVVAKPGAMVIWHGEGDPVKIKKTKMRGVDSFGMICGASEVGLEDIYPVEDDHEIVILKEENIKPGDNIADILGLNDEVLEIDNKSLTNRPDLYCHYGIARELAAIYGLELKELPKYEHKGVKEYSVDIRDSAKCRRLLGAVIENVRPVESPMWLKTALLKVGMRPRNILVDISNYVMLAVGQPNHAFDKNHIDTGIVVKTANDGERLELLFGKVANLDSNDLVIADHVKSLGLAGIMGGKYDSVSDETSAIVLEMGNFNHRSIRRTSKKNDLRTEASIRYEKNLDTQRVDQAFGLAMKLFTELIEGAKLTQLSDVIKEETKCEVIEVSIPFLCERLGKEVSAEEVESYLKPLGFKVETSGDTLKVTAPTWRSTGDISLKDDILEEVARMIGYENFEASYPTVKLNPIINQRDFDKEREITEFLAFRAGFREIFTYPWVEEKYLKAIGTDLDSLIKLSDPPSPSTQNLRPSVIPSILNAIEVNHKNFEEFKIFELARVFLKGECSPTSPDEVLPLEENRLAGAIVGLDIEEIFFEMKGVIEGLNSLKIEPLSFTSEEQPNWADKKLWLNIVSEDEIIGSLGAASIKTLADSDIKNTMAVLFEINVEKIVALKSRTNSPEPLPLFPAVLKDISVLIDEVVSWEEIAEVVSPLVKKLYFVDEYKGKQVPDGKKSITFRFEHWSNENTLTTEDIDQKMNQIINKLSGKFGADLRK